MGSLDKKKDVFESDQQFLLHFYESYKAYLFYSAHKFAESHSDCEDIVQDVMVRLMRNIATLRQLNKKQTATYLFLTVRSVYADRMKSAQERNISVSDISLVLLNNAQVGDDDEEELNAKWDTEILKKSLSQKDWALLESKYIMNHSDSEIARELNCAPDSIRTMLRRARERAKAILDDK